MSKITPYTALRDLFRHKVDDAEDLETKVRDTEKNGNLVLLEPGLMKVSKINNSCQTQPLRDYGVDKVMQTIKNKCSEIHVADVQLQDDNFQILRPDYATYSGEKPYVEAYPAKHKKIKLIPEKPEKEYEELNFTPLFNRKRMHIKEECSVTNNPEETFEKKSSIIKCNEQDSKSLYPDLNFKKIQNSKENIFRFSGDTVPHLTNQIRPSFRHQEVNALYKTVSNLKSTFQQKYHNDNDNEKCLCDHCGALAVVSESLKRPIIFEDSEEENHHQKRQRHRRERHHCEDREYLKLRMKLKMMEERIHELEEAAYVDGPIKIRKSALTFDMYTQCYKRKHKTQFDESKERSFSPKRFYYKKCNFPFSIPPYITEKLCRRRSSEERSSKSEANSDSDDVQCKVKHISRVPNKIPYSKPKLRSHDYIKKKQEVVEPIKKPGFWKSSSKTYNIETDTKDIPTKDDHSNVITDKQIQELLIELNNKRNRAAEAKVVRFDIGLPSQSNNEEDMSSYSSKQQNIDLDMQNQHDYFFLKQPELIEQFVKHSSTKTRQKHHSLDNQEEIIPDSLIQKPKVKTIPIQNTYITDNIFQTNISNPTPLRSRRINRQQEEMFKIIQTMKPRTPDFYNKSSTSSQKEIKTLIENIPQTSATESKSICQYINSNFTDKTSTSDGINSSFTSSKRNLQISKQSSSNKNVVVADTRIPKIINAAKPKKLNISLSNIENEDKTKNIKYKNFVELNKNVKAYVKSRCTTKYNNFLTLPRKYNSEKKKEEIPNLLNENTVPIKSIEQLSEPPEINKTKQWHFSFLDLKSEDVKEENETMKVNKKEIIKQLSKLSNEVISSSSTQDYLKISETDLNDIMEGTDRCNENVVKKSSFFSVIKKYSKHLICKRKSKCIYSTKKTKIFDKNYKIGTKIPVYKSPERIRKSLNHKRSKSVSPARRMPTFIHSQNYKNVNDIILKEENSTAKIKAKTIPVQLKPTKKIDQFCMFKPNMMDKSTKLSMENISISKYNIKPMRNYDLSVQTLVISSIDSMIQNSSPRLNNIIIFNSANQDYYNRNLPTISEQNSNLTLQTNVVQHDVPSNINHDASKIIILPANNTTNPYCTKCPKQIITHKKKMSSTSQAKDPKESKNKHSKQSKIDTTKCNICDPQEKNNEKICNPPCQKSSLYPFEPESSSKYLLHKSSSLPSKTNKINIDTDFKGGKCSSKIKCAPSETKIKELSYLENDTKEVKTESSKAKLKNKGIIEKKAIKKQLKEKKESIESIKADKTLKCVCETSNLKIPKVSGFLSSLRRSKNKIQKSKCNPERCAKPEDSRKFKSIKEDAPQIPIVPKNNTEKEEIQKTGSEPCVCEPFTINANSKTKKKQGKPKCTKKCIKIDLSTAQLEKTFSPNILETALLRPSSGFYKEKPYITTESHKQKLLQSTYKTFFTKVLAYKSNYLKYVSELADNKILPKQSIVKEVNEIEEKKRVAPPPPASSNKRNSKECSNICKLKDDEQEQLEIIESCKLKDDEQEQLEIIEPCKLKDAEQEQLEIVEPCKLKDDEQEQLEIIEPSKLKDDEQEQLEIIEPKEIISVVTYEDKSEQIDICCKPSKAGPSAKSYPEPPEVLPTEPFTKAEDDCAHCCISSGKQSYERIRFIEESPICSECKVKLKRSRPSDENLTRKSSSIKRICNLKRMKNKIKSKFSCKYFKSMYKRPIIAVASRMKSREMRNRARNFCDVSRNDFEWTDTAEQNCQCSSQSMNRASVVNIFYNMQGYNFDITDEVSYTDDDLNLTAEEKRRYLLEKLYLMQDFRDRFHSQGNCSNYGSFQ